MKPSEKQVSSKAIPVSKLGSRKSTIGIPDPKLVTPERLIKNMKLSFVPPTKPKAPSENYTVPTTSNYSVKNITAPVLKKPLKEVTTKSRDQSPKLNSQETPQQSKITSQKSTSNIRPTSQTRSGQASQKPDGDLKGSTTNNFFKNGKDESGISLPIRASSRNVSGILKEPIKTTTSEKRENVPITKSKPAKIIISRTKHLETCLKFVHILVRGKTLVAKQKAFDKIIAQVSVCDSKTSKATSHSGTRPYYNVDKISDETLLSVNTTQKTTSTNLPSTPIPGKAKETVFRPKSISPNNLTMKTADGEPLPDKVVKFIKQKAQKKIFNLLLTGLVEGFTTETICRAKFKRWKRQRTFDCWRAIVMHLRGRDPGMEFQSYTLAKMTRNLSLLTKAFIALRHR
jgi:hypothetical protein